MLIVLAGLFFACTNMEQKNDKETTREPEKKILTVNEVMENPDLYLDKEIKVEGIVTHVCQHGGKRLHLSAPDSDVKLRVRAGKKTGNFKREMEGSNVMLTGKFIEEKMDEEYINKLKSGNIKEDSGEHEDDDHEKETVIKKEQDAKGVSEAFIKEMEAKIANSEKGYVSEYWLESIKIEKK